VPAFVFIKVTRVSGLGFGIESVPAFVFIKVTRVSGLGFGIESVPAFVFIKVKRRDAHHDKDKNDGSKRTFLPDTRPIT
jgi:hypothetical protein